MDKLGSLGTENEKRAVIQKTLRDNGLLRKERCIMVKASFEKRVKKKLIGVLKQFIKLDNT